MLDSTGISNHVELYNFHPGAAEASQGFLDAPGLPGTFDVTGMDPSGFAGGPAAPGDQGSVLGGAEAGAVTGVLEVGSGFFDHVDPADLDRPARREPGPRREDRRYRRAAPPPARQPSGRPPPGP